MRKKITSLILSALLIGVMVVPIIGNSTNNQSNNTYKIMGIWPDPTNG